VRLVRPCRIVLFARPVRFCYTPAYLVLVLLRVDSSGPGIPVMTGRWILAVLALSVSSRALAADTEPPPNFIVIFADDMGYGDLGCFGHPTIATPELDRLATEGQRWTDFYAAASICTPSRAALMTGRLPIRSGMCHDSTRVLFPDSSGGLPPEEVTMAELLKELGYATACIGKWHLGHLPQYMPTSQGFDSYFGIPFANSMNQVKDAPSGMMAYRHPRPEYWDLPLVRDLEQIERPADQTTITKRYTEEALRFIRANYDRPFYCYLAHTMPHVPLFASEEFQGRSRRGLYGDAVEEIDWGVGQIVQTLRELGIEERTLLVFTSDNGPWLGYYEQAGSAGLLRGDKGSTWEGGMREPTVFSWPGTIKPGVIRQMGSTLDILPTCVKLAGGELPVGLVLDGVDLSPVLLGTGESPRDTMFYYRGTKVFAVRHGEYKAHFTTQTGYGGDEPVSHDPPLLCHLGHDPGELYDVAADHPEIIAELRKIVDQHQKSVTPGECQMTGVLVE
jgi:arylsulfatase A